MDKPRKFTELLAGQGMAPLQHLMQHGKRLARLNMLILDILGNEDAAGCRVANLRGTTLVLAVTSPAWASRLRYQIPRLLQQFQSDSRLPAITDIQIRVMPEQLGPKPRPPRRATMSASAAHCIEQCAEHISDAKLSAALKRLAGRHARKR